MGTYQVWLGWLLLGVISVAEGAGVLDVLPPTAIDEAVPNISQVLAYQWGEEISDPEQIRRYAELLVAAAPDRIRLIPYAKSLEGRELFLLILGKPQLLVRLDELAARFRELGDPRRVAVEKQEALIRELPAVVWLMSSVHGDEASGGEAALALAYYLLAAQTADVHELLDRVIVVLDPMQNPDGRGRFVAATRQARGLEHALESLDAEHVQPWPGGRFSHLLFDLNRDWLVLTHPESQGRVERLLWLPPQVVVDLHEMGSEQGYFFPPPADPHNPLVSQGQAKLWQLLGKNLAAAFDGAGIRFWTREVFDAFFPGYGESWPLFNGACGATFEQASTRGRAVRLSTGEVLRYEDAVAHHLLAAFVTLKTVAEHKELFTKTWLEYRRQTVAEGKGKVFLWRDVGDGGRSLAALLVKHGLEVYKVDAGTLAGHFLLPQGQPLGKLAKALLAREIPLPTDFAELQQRREAKRLPDEIYDLTAWSLPLLWDVQVEEKTLPLPSEARLLPVDYAPEGKVIGEGKVGFVMPWDGLASAQALVALLKAGVKAGVAERPFRVAGRDFPRGSAVIFRRKNPEDLEESLGRVAKLLGVTFYGTDTSLAESGLDLGSNRVRPVKLPSVALLWDAPTAPTAAGHLRFALEYQLRLPTTVIRTQSLASAPLDRFQVIVMPDAYGASSYSRFLPTEAVERLKNWVKEGGVLVAEGEGAAFLTQEKVGLLASQLEKRKGPKPVASEQAAKETSYQQAIQPQEEDPPRVPGAILTVDLDEEELLTAGLSGRTLRILVNSRRVFTPLKLDVGRNLGIYAERERLLSSGFIFEESLKLLSQKAYLMMQRHGKGLVLAFAEPPAFRGMTRSGTLLLANAVLLGPALSGTR
ncbi:MAG: M14 family metallopeptidase [Thermoanaerobaculaceae bacterium]